MRRWSWLQSRERVIVASGILAYLVIGSAWLAGERSHGVPNTGAVAVAWLFPMVFVVTAGGLAWHARRHWWWRAPALADVTFMTAWVLLLAAENAGLGGSSLGCYMSDSGDLFVLLCDGPLPLVTEGWPAWQLLPAEAAIGFVLALLIALPVRGARFLVSRMSARQAPRIEQPG